MSTLAERVKSRRSALGITRAALAACAGVTPSHIRAIESGRIQTPHSIRAIAIALGTDPIWLAGGIESPSFLSVYNPAARAIEVQRQWEAEMERARGMRNAWPYRDPSPVEAAGMATAGNLADPDPIRVKKYVLFGAGIAVGLALSFVARLV